MRDTYFKGEDLSGKSLKDAGIYAQSTDINRTKQSATSQLQGLYGTKLTFPDLETDKYPLIIDADGNRLILIDQGNCKRM